MRLIRASFGQRRGHHRRYFGRRGVSGSGAFGQTTGARGQNHCGDFAGLGERYLSAVLFEGQFDPVTGLPVE